LAPNTKSASRDHLGPEEVGVAPQQDTIAVETDKIHAHPDFVLEALRTPGVAGPVARVEDLLGVGQGDQQRMVAPGPLVADVDPLLATRPGGRDRAVEIDHRGSSQDTVCVIEAHGIGSGFRNLWLMSLSLTMHRIAGFMFAMRLLLFYSLLAFILCSGCKQKASPDEIRNGDRPSPPSPRDRPGQTRQTRDRPSPPSRTTATSGMHGLADNDPAYIGKRSQVITIEDEAGRLRRTETRVQTTPSQNSGPSGNLVARAVNRPAFRIFVHDGKRSEIALQ